MSENRVVGILSRLDLEWLDLAAAKVADGCSSEEVRAALFERLSPLLAGGEKRGSARYKTVTVLARVWLTVPAEAVGLRDRALELLPNATQQERTALHWAMLCVSYPFWADVAAAAGRLLSLQGVVVLTQVIRFDDVWDHLNPTNRGRLVQAIIHEVVVNEPKNRVSATLADIAMPELPPLPDDDALDGRPRLRVVREPEVRP